ncbi:hypothetical protein MP638_005355 [Amoeboaphelidium occidentale]|nr:hypothetical protein MP638_005355 [Amoeboaphelidium occidentale]
MVYNKVKGKAPLQRILDYDPLPSEEEIIQDCRMEFEVLLKICPCFFGEPCSPVAYSSCSKDVVFGCRCQNDPEAKRKLYELAKLLAPIFGCFSRELILYLWEFKNPLLQEEQEKKEGIEEFLGALAGGDLKRDLVIKSPETKPAPVVTTHPYQQLQTKKFDFLPIDEDSEWLEESCAASEDDDLEERRISFAASSARSNSMDIKEVVAASMPPKDPPPPPPLSTTLTALPNVPTILEPPSTPPAPHGRKSSWRGIKKGFKAAFKRLFKSFICS